MVFSQITTTPGEVSSIAIKAEYIQDPVPLFAELTKHSQHALLLESAEIDSKDNLKSLVLLDTAVTFECTGQSVDIRAISDNGVGVLTHLSRLLSNYQADVKLNVVSEKQLRVCFQGILENQTEQARLKQINAFEALRAAVNQINASTKDEFAVFLAGTFAYDMLANFESLPEVEGGANTCPDYVFYLAETLLVIDHQKHTTDIIGNVFSGESAYANCFTIGKRLEHIHRLIKDYAPAPAGFGYNEIGQRTPVDVNISDDAFKQKVIDLKQHIIEGDIFQVVPSRCFSLECDEPLDAYRHLKHDNPSPYMFYLVHPDFTLFGASPESALKFDAKSRQVEVYPIAGTRKRGTNLDGSLNLDLDSRIELELRRDEKEVAEHMMLVDLARNDVARISETGTRHVKELLKVDRYSYVMHLVSRVVGKLKPELDALHAYQACMNMGTLVGAPKIKAASLIREVEGERRGSYGGAVGYLNGQGDMDSCIVIRSAFVKNGLAHIQAGAGVVYDSAPQSEADETRNKAQAVIKAVQASQAFQKTKGGEFHA